MNATHNPTDWSNGGMNELEKTTLFSSKCCKVDISPVQSKEVRRIVTAILNTGAGSYLAWRDIVLTSLKPLTRPLKISLRPVGDKIFKASGVTLLLIVLEDKLLTTCLEFPKYLLLR